MRVRCRRRLQKIYRTRGRSLPLANSAEKIPESSRSSLLVRTASAGNCPTVIASMRDACAANVIRFFGHATRQFRRVGGPSLNLDHDSTPPSSWLRHDSRHRSWKQAPPRGILNPGAARTLCLDIVNRAMDECYCEQNLKKRYSTGETPGIADFAGLLTQLKSFDG